MHERRFHPSQMHKLEDPERKKWLPPEDVLAQLELQPGWTVADIGAGTGYFALPIAEAIGESGHLLAVDASPEMLARLRARAEEQRLSNIRCSRAEASATGLESASCDCLLMANVWHEFDDHAAVLIEARRILRPGAKIAVLDWRPDAKPDHGPPIEHRISAAVTREALALAGFAVAPSVALFPYSWLVQATR